MDASKQYIKMCDCRDVQELKYGYATDKSFWYSMPNEWWGTEEYGGDVWLPRQDQLQEMYCDGCGGRHYPLQNLLDDFYNFLHRSCWLPNDYRFPNQPVVRDFTSMEQLWLAFAMKEKYGKIWNGTDWIKDG